MHMFNVQKKKSSILSLCLGRRIIRKWRESSGYLFTFVVLGLNLETCVCETSTEQLSYNPQPSFCFLLWDRAWVVAQDGLEWSSCSCFLRDRHPDQHHLPGWDSHLFKTSPGQRGGMMGMVTYKIRGQVRRRNESFSIFFYGFSLWGKVQVLYMWETKFN